MSGAGLLAPLRRPAFRRLALSYTVNELGDWLGIVALSVLVFDQTGSALATAALFLGTGFLPALLTPLLVVRAERGAARYVLPVIYCGEAAVFGGLALSADRFSLPVVVALAALDGTLALAARSLTRAVAASMLAEAGELRAGNAILNVAFTGGAAVGPAIAGLVVAGFGVQSALLLDAASFYLVAVVLLTAGKLPQAEPEGGRFAERLRAGIAYVRERRDLRGLICAQAIAFVFFSAVIPVEVIFAKETLGAGDTGYGLMLASWGGGMVLGSVAFAALRGASLGLLLIGSTAAIGAGYLGMAAAPTLAVACAAAALGGAGNGVQWVSVVSAVQEMTSEPMQARVMSVLESSGAVMPAIGYLAGGAVAAALEPRAAFVMAGVGVLAVLGAAAPILASEWRMRGDRLRMANEPSGNTPVVELRPMGTAAARSRRLASEGDHPESTTRGLRRS
ncbi:MAG TPA: MFS transporter [Solirubrobacterales bacterium]|nr:MFS transporter [Solirubrobacterales bacterium]